MPRTYLPMLLALKLPEIFLVLGFGGAAGALIAASRRDVAANRRAVLFVVGLAALLPLAVTVALRPAMLGRLLPGISTLAVHVADPTAPRTM